VRDFRFASLFGLSATVFPQSGLMRGLGRGADGRVVKTCKVVVVGESTVGKTSIINVANTGEFQPNESPTVGACFVTNNYCFSDRSVRLNIWDTAGQERYRSLAPMYYREMDVGCIVYSVDSLSSFEAVKGWYEGFREQVGSQPKFYLLGNKKDLESSREVTSEKGASLAQSIGAIFKEISAKTDYDGVKDLFKEIAMNVSEPEPALITGTSTEPVPVTSQSECC
jgi:small GTP-binding protein